MSKRMGVGAVAVVFGIFVLGRVVGSRLPSDILCENTIAQSISNSAGDRWATVFTRDCGSTTGIGTQVMIRPSAGPVDGPGNVFQAVWRGARPESVQTGPPVTVEWQGDRTIMIIVEEGTRVTLTREVADVQVWVRDQGG